MGYSAAPGAVISVSVEGVAASQRQIDAMAASMNRLSENVASAMRSLAAGAGLGGGLAEVAQLSDQYTKMTSQLKLATNSQREFAASYAEVKRISAETQSDLSGTAVLYARIANGTRELAIGQQKVAALTEVVNLALRVSGATTEEAASAQLQLSQAFASGTLRGEEFNAVNEAAPRLMRALADGMGVPVGMLKQMATEGKITSEVMADVLPRSLEQLRNEAREVQTIGGAFTVLKNNALEFTATSAQANGTVALLTGGIGLLANNLTLVAGALTTVTAVKATTWAQSWTVETYKKIAAAQADRAATLAAAQADLARVQATGVQAAATQGALVTARAEMVARLGQANANILAAQAAIEAATAAGVQSFALRTLRLATGELAVAETARAASLAELAILGQQQARVSAEIAAARTAETAATTALNTAQAGGALGAGLATRALGLLGGPLGAIVTVLGLGATAWALWGNNAKQASAQAAETYDEANQRILKGLDEQIAKNERLLQLRAAGMSKTDADRNLPIVNQITAATQRLDDINQRRNAFAVGAGKSETEVDLARLAVLQDIAALSDKMQKRNSTQDQVDAGGSALTDVIGVRERLLGVNKQYLEDLGKLQTAREKGAIGEHEYIALVSQLAAETWKSSEAGKAATATASKEKTAYESLMGAIREKLAAGALEMNGYDKLAESQKLTIKLNEDIAAGKIRQGSAEAKSAAALIAQRKAQEDVIAAQQRAADGAEAFNKIARELADGRARSIEDALREADGNERLAATFGMSKAAIEAQELARLEEQLAQRASMGLTLDEIATLEQLIAAKRRSAAALASLDTQEANKKAVDQMVADTRRGAEQIEQSITDAIVRGGKNGADYLQDLFRTLVLRPYVQMLMTPQSTQLATGVLTGGGPTGAPATAGNPLLGAAQAASNLYGMLKAGGGFEQSIANGVQSVFDKMGLSQSGGGASDAATFAGRAGGTVGGYMLGSSLNSAISGQYQTGSGFQTAEKVGTAIASYFAGPVGGAIAGAVSGLINRAFGMGNMEVTATGMRGTLSAGGLNGSNYSAWHQDGGWFRGDRDGTDTSAFSIDETRQFTQGLAAIEAASSSYAQRLGVSADLVTSYAKDFDIKLGSDQAANQKTIADFFSGIGDELATKLVPNLDQFIKSGESASATLERLAGDFQGTDQVAQLLGVASATVFGAIGLDSAAARERLIDLAGGVATLGQQAQFFNQNFLTDAERIAPVAAALDAALGSLGLATIPTTRAEFKALIDAMIASGAVATETGARQFEALMSLEQAFAQVHPQIDATATSLASLKDAASGLLGNVDGAFSVLQNVVAREKATLQGRIDAESALVASSRALSDALHGALDSMRLVGQEAADVAAARATLKTALVIARAGGPLPDAASLQKALATAGQDGTHYASYEDYLLATRSTQSDIAELAKLSDSSLSAEEKTLAALQAEAKQLDDLLAHEQALLDEAKGQSTTLLSIDDAVRGLASALLGAQKNPVVAATSAINNAYQGALGRAPDADGLAFWQNQAASGLSTSAIVDAIRTSPEAQIDGLYQSLLGRAPDAGGLDFFLHSGASIDAISAAMKSSAEYTALHPSVVGTNFMPEAMPALAQQGGIVSAADSAETMRRLASPAASNDALLAEIRLLREQVALLQKPLETTAASTSQHADQFDQLTAGGNAMRMEN